MSADVWRRVEELFYDVADLPSEDRAAVLDQACRGDPDLRREVEALLEARDRIGDFLTPQGLVRQIATPTPEPAATRVGTTLGGYEIMAALGAGAMGEVSPCLGPQPRARGRAENSPGPSHPRLIASCSTAIRGPRCVRAQPSQCGHDLRDWQ